MPDRNRNRVTRNIGPATSDPARSILFAEQSAGMRSTGSRPTACSEALAELLDDAAMADGRADVQDAAIVALRDS